MTKFEKFNANPKGRKACDCVIRAISTATGKSWEDVYKDLVVIGLKKCDVINAKPVFQKLLEDYGFTKCKQPRKSDGLKYKVGEVDCLTQSKVVVISMANHLTVVVNGAVKDTWDCRHKTISNYWVK